LTGGRLTPVSGTRERDGIMSRVVHFEFATLEPETEVAFFHQVFGWDIQRWGEEEYWLASTGPKEDAGINGAIMPLRSPDHARVVNTVEVENIDVTIARATELGATIAMEKQDVPQLGFLAYLVSPTGIAFGLIQPAPDGMAD
jgi:uncharacterized protein